MRILLTSVLLLAALPSAAAAAIGHPTSPAKIVLRISSGGGFVTPQTNLRALPSFTLYGDGTVIVPGVITHSTDGIEHPELASQRIQRFAGVVGRENVIAGSDCGFGGRTHPQIAWAKLKALVEGAALASKALF